jgi:8-amino-7-oxononanoate synthase
MREDSLRRRLDKRKELGMLRTLKVHSEKIDFCSNDYLGFARSPLLYKNIEDYCSKNRPRLAGSTGSRLLAGNSTFVEELEKSIAQFHKAPSGLIFNSGYDANIGLFSCVPQRDDLVLYDEYIHASICDGMRLGKAETVSFRHNDLEDAGRKMISARNPGNKRDIFIAVESVYSMDGDRVPLQEMAKLCERYEAKLIVDEAHATGVIGAGGAGLVNDLGLEEACFARLHTFGKALGCHGAILLGSDVLRNYLINFARSFIYTTALPYHALASVKCAYELLPMADKDRMELNDRIRQFGEAAGVPRSLSTSPIQCVIIPGNENVKAVALQLQHDGYDIRPILSPTVPRGKERLRICLHAFNTREEAGSLIEILQRIIR